MAVTLVRETWKPQREGSFQIEKAKRDYVRTFLVTTNSVNDGPETVLFAVDPNDSTKKVPQLYDSYVEPNGQFDVGVLCTKVTPKQNDENPFVWTVRADYSSEGIDQALSQENPIQRRPEIRWDFQQYEKPVLDDLDGRQMANSAGDPFYPAVTIDDSRPTLSITFNVAQADRTLAFAYKDAINNDVWLVDGVAVPPLVAKVMRIAIDAKLFENNQVYDRVTMDFAFRPETWIMVQVDQGFRQLAADNVTLIAVLDKFGRQVSQPVPLNGAGKVLKVGPGVKLTELSFNVYKQLPFTGLTPAG